MPIHNNRNEVAIKNPLYNSLSDRSVSHKNSLVRKSGSKIFSALEVGQRAGSTEFVTHSETFLSRVGTP